MASLKDDFEVSGNWLFRRRSYIPLALIAVAFLGMRNYHYPFKSHAGDCIWEILCLAVSMFGLGLRAATVGQTPKGTCGRNTRGQRADCLITSGMYSVVRHPLYLGNFFIWLGVSMFVHLWWVCLVFMLLFSLYYERIMFAEEEFLRKKFGPQFTGWATATPAFFPNVFKWKPAELPFSWRNVLRREYSGFFAIIACFTFLETVGDWFIFRRLVWDPVWICLFTGGLAVYLVLRFLKKRTSLLRVEGR